MLLRRESGDDERRDPWHEYRENYTNDNDCSGDVGETGVEKLFGFFRFVAVNVFGEDRDECRADGSHDEQLKDEIRYAEGRVVGVDTVDSGSAGAEVTGECVVARESEYAADERGYGEENGAGYIEFLLHRGIIARLLHASRGLPVTMLLASSFYGIIL